MPAAVTPKQEAEIIRRLDAVFFDLRAIRERLERAAAEARQLVEGAKEADDA